MKVIVAAPYIYKKDWPEFTKNRTGLGIMVNDVFESISEYVDAYLISLVITKGHGNVLKHTWFDVLIHAKLKDWIKGFKYFLGYKQSLFNRIKYFYYALNSGFIRKSVRRLKPDVVHIHGIGMHTKPFIDVCEEENVPYIVTLHGLIGFDESVRAPLWDKDMERAFLIVAEKRNIPVTVISSGMKRKIEEKYLHHEAKNITVICNGTRISNEEKTVALNDVDLRKEYCLTNEKIVVAIGSICERKNQMQIVRALATGTVLTPCHLFLCGVDMTNGNVQKVIEEMGLSNRIHLLGFLSKEKIHQILSQADLNVVASKDEGFGLSIIEAAAHGVPTVTFSDLDAIPDLYDKKSMICVVSRDDSALAKGIENGLTMVWDRKWLQKYVKKFSIEVMSEKYKIEYSYVVCNFLQKRKCI